jgi:tetratricopeptide (TPR) repeat protein
MHGLSSILIAGLAAGALLAGASDARADAAQDCRSGNPDSRIGGCSRLLAEARTARQRAIALDGRCWAQIDRAAFAEALVDCNAAIRADDQYPYAFHNRGVAYAGLQNPTAAIVDFNRALAMRPNFSNYPAPPGEGLSGPGPDPGGDTGLRGGAAREAGE